MARVLLPQALVRLFPAAPRCLDVEAADVAGAIAVLDARWPGMRDRLVDSTPAIRRHLNLFVDGERAALATPLRPESELLVTTAMSGG